MGYSTHMSKKFPVNMEHRLAVKPWLCRQRLSLGNARKNRETSICNPLLTVSHTESTREAELRK
jgi:hypothetical protein